jgi:soluble lytic murein transglycosylase-like protein
LPGTPDPALATLGQPPGAVGAAVLARFDAVAHRIPYAAEIRSAAIEAGIDPLLLASMVRAESNFRADAVSRAGAMGLTQLMPATAKALGVDNPFDPAENLRGGARYIGSNLRIYGRVDLALAAYQAGKGAVAAAGGIPDSPTTRNYIAVILRTWSGYLEASA